MWSASLPAISLNLLSCTAAPRDPCLRGILQQQQARTGHITRSPSTTSRPGSSGLSLQTSTPPTKAMIAFLKLKIRAPAATARTVATSGGARRPNANPCNRGSGSTRGDDHYEVVYKRYKNKTKVDSKSAPGVCLQSREPTANGGGRINNKTPTCGSVLCVMNGCWGSTTSNPTSSFLRWRSSSPPATTHRATRARSRGPNTG